MTQIIGIFLVKNEDLFIEQAVRNIVDFCDKIIICDNYSSDNTWDIVTRLSNEISKIQINRITMPKESHRFVEEYAGTETWVFAVDGDEIYDPLGLKKLREELLAGKYNDYFKLVGNTLHVDFLNENLTEARGYLAPPAKNVTKLYNFNALTVWRNPPYERLHGGEQSFKEGYHSELRLLFENNHTWDNSHYRCLHMCFMRRSTQEDESKMYARLIPDEKKERESYFKAFLNRWFKKDENLSGIQKSTWKLQKYKVGNNESRLCDVFFRTL